VKSIQVVPLNILSSLMDADKKLLLSGKRFFIDQTVDSSSRKKISDCLALLGGTAEDFLDKTINYVITMAPDHDKGLVESQSSLESPFSCVSQASPQNNKTTKNKATNSKWRHLAQRAARSSRITNDPIQTARNLGIKIRNAKESLEWLLKKTKHMEKAGHNSSSNSSQCILLKSPCIKVDDKVNKPFYEELGTLYQLDVTVEGHGSPFKQPGKSPHRPEKKRRSSNKEKRGFCEGCQSSYLSEKKHFKSAEHIKFGKTPENFAKLDQFVVNNNLSLQAMKKRFNVTAAFDDRGCHNEDKNNVREGVTSCEPAASRLDVSCKISSVFESQATSSKYSPMNSRRIKSPRLNNASPPANSSPALRRLVRKRRRQESSLTSSPQNHIVSPQKPYLLRSMRSSELSPTKPGSSTNAYLKSSSSPFKRPVR